MVRPKTSHHITTAWFVIIVTSSIISATAADVIISFKCIYTKKKNK